MFILTFPTSTSIFLQVILFEKVYLEEERRLEKTLVHWRTIHILNPFSGFHNGQVEIYVVPGLEYFR